MTDHQLISPAHEVRAFLAGATQFRRAVKLSDPTETYACFDDDGWPLPADKAVKRIYRS